MQRDMASESSMIRQYLFVMSLRSRPMWRMLMPRLCISYTVLVCLLSLISR
jgi:hypothetical protein